MVMLMIFMEFLGNSPKTNYAFMNYEYTRILKNYDSKFSNVDSMIVRTKVKVILDM